MNKIFTAALLLLILKTTLSGQTEDWYAQQLNAGIVSLDSANTLKGYTQSSVFFYRIFETNPNDWRSAYYYIYASLKCTEDSNLNNKPVVLNAVQTFFDQSGKKFSGLVEFNILEAKLKLHQYQYTNDSVALLDCAFLLKNALAGDQKNIRAHYVLAQYFLVKYPDSEYGRQQAGECIQLALENSTKKPEDEFLPYAWGKSDLEAMAARLKLQ